MYRRMPPLLLLLPLPIFANVMTDAMTDDVQRADVLQIQLRADDDVHVDDADDVDVDQVRWAYSLLPLYSSDAVSVVNVDRVLILVLYPSNWHNHYVVVCYSWMWDRCLSYFVYVPLRDDFETKFSPVVRRAKVIVPTRFCDVL